MSNNNSSSRQPNESNENVTENDLKTNLIHFPPPRTPLNTIPDPFQLDDNFEGARTRRLSDRKADNFDMQLNKALAGLSNATPRVSGRGRPNSEPNSAQSTPGRIFSRVSGVPHHQSGARGGGGNSRVSRGLPIVGSEDLVEVSHFELEEDPSFWKDHNVQVLIRVRPLSNSEMVSQGHGRCLRQESAQSLVWLGHPETRFTFDHVVSENISQEKLFKVVGLPMVDNCMSGYNSCIFAYGQTGSGKTYTMMGEIHQMDEKFDEDWGITPRIFEYLFTKITKEEEKRQDERLNYICKCSFLEIYNEHITDLLEPSSTNLQLREDLKKGVYVESLTEHSVKTVNDVLKLLLQGAANRKIAATHMNSESSRSHSVFTCTVESRWEKDSMTHFRFGRLNLVDLAGSERQKGSGAEGDRLKEAANINKSLSTLGLVIMSLVDLAHGKHRHVPYRDSRLTFLLQDSLGGNSKTTIIANVSPSICSANETLSTLKFAQRAKLIQNNAKINEDASGNVTAMQRQIQQLQGQLSLLMKHSNISKSFASSVPSLPQSSMDDTSEENSYSEDGYTSNDNSLSVQERKIESLEATLASALSKEKSGQAAVRRLESEIECMKCIAQQREDDIQCAQMMLKSGEEKIRRLELFAEGLVSAEKYLVEENRSLKEQNQRLRERIDKQLSFSNTENENTELRFTGGLEDYKSQKAVTDSTIKDLENFKQLDSYSSSETISKQCLRSNEGTGMVFLQAKLDRLTQELEKANLLNCQYQEDHALQLSQNQQSQLVCEQVEMETAKTILQLQEDVAALQFELEQKLSYTVEENTKLRDTVAAKEDEIKALSKEWEKATRELTSFLFEGSKYLGDASGQVEKIVCSFPSSDSWLGEHVEKAAKVCIEKEETIVLLQKSLEDAQDMVMEMEQKLDSLKGAAHVFAGVQLEEKSLTSKEITKLTLLNLSNEVESSANGLSQADNTNRDIELARKNLEESLFTKLDEALSSTEEADIMLNALLKANENAQEMTGMWKEACEKLMIEKVNFITEAEELKSIICSKDTETEMLQDQIKICLKEAENAIALLEQSFLVIQRDVEEMMKVTHFDALAIVQDVLKCFSHSKLSLEAIECRIMDQGSVLSVHKQSHSGGILEKFLSPTDASALDDDRPQKSFLSTNNSLQINYVIDCREHSQKLNPGEILQRLDETKSAAANDGLMDENKLLKKELKRKEDVLKGLLFDFSLLQESASTKKDMKDEIDKLIEAFSQAQIELQIKTDELNNLEVWHSQLEARFFETENALVMSNSDLEQAKRTVDLLTDQIDEFRVLLKDIYLRQSEVEEQLEEEREVVKTLEKEILRINDSPEKKLYSSIEDIEKKLRSVTTERDLFLQQVSSLQEKLNLAYSLVDENEAIAVEARQESEASKIFAERKEEEVRILENSVEELERTINALEKKVYEMEEEVENQKLIRDSLEVELQALKERMMSVETFTEDRCSENSNAGQLLEDQLFRKLQKRTSELQESNNQIRLLEEERAEKAKEIRQFKEYISELVLHAEAQASQYQQKYKTLEEMFREVSRDSSTLTSVSLVEDKSERTLTKPRGSSSPFKCISNLVQQVNLEKDRELSAAKLHIVELEELAASRQKEVCMLNTRLAAAESMTHDVIRDLLGVKLDITNYANLIDQYQLQKLVENAELHTEEATAMENEIRNLGSQINELVEERERFISEINRRQTDILAAQLTVEQLRERDQLFTTQNEMLKADNSSLKRKMMDLDEMVKKLFTSQSVPMRPQQPMKIKENNFPKHKGDSDLGRRLEKSEKLLLQVNNELAHYHKSENRNGQDKVDSYVLEIRTRNLR